MYKHSYTTYALAALILASTSSTAHAFRVIGADPAGGTTCAGTPLPCDTDQLVARWMTTPVPFWVNQDAASDAADPNLTQMDVVNAARDAYQVWEDAPDAMIKFAWVSETPARLGADGVNTTLFYDAAQEAGACAGALGTASGTLAITVLTELAGTGEIVDADVIFDSADTWELSNACVNFDILSTAVHEYGHAIGVHHTDVFSASPATRPSMAGGYFCDAGIASGRSLEADDEEAAACLYPATAAVVVMDQTGSMSVDTRMMDAQESANAFVDDLSDNELVVSAFASDACGRDGYDQLQDWTTSVADLQTAVVSTSPCGNTPLWESACCSLGKAIERNPSSVLIVTDTEENDSDGVCSSDCPAGYCGCADAGDAAGMYTADDIPMYVIDVTEYHGTGDFSQKADGSQAYEGKLDVRGERDRCVQKPTNTDGQQLLEIARRTGGLYCSATDNAQLERARIAIQRHMTRAGRERDGKEPREPQLKPVQKPVEGPTLYPGTSPTKTPLRY